MRDLVLAVSPGTGSTRMGLFRGTELVAERVLHHASRDLAGSGRVSDQLGWHARAVRAFLEGTRVALSRVAAVVGRGGLLRPVPSGTYLVDGAMLQDAARAARGEHAGTLGPALAQFLAEECGCPAFVVDPISVDELDPVARYAGLAGMARQSQCHALDIRAVARRHARVVEQPLEELRLVVAHLGAGTSLAAVREGRLVDVVNPRDEGPFSGDCAGGVPVTALVELCFETGASKEEVLRRLDGNGGLGSHLGTRDVHEAEERAERGDARAMMALDAMAYQTAKAVAGMAVALGGEVHAILLTGGGASATALGNALCRRIEWIAPVFVYPGEDELAALADGAWRAVTGEEPARRYG